MSMRFYPSLLLWLFILPWRLEAGDWMLSEGEQTLYASLSLSQADSYWDDQRALQQDSCSSRDWRTTLHYEYGYSYYRTLFASTAFERNQCGSESAVGVPDVKLGMRGRVNPFRNGFSWELAAIIPVNGDRLDRRKPGNGLFGIEAGLFRSYLDDPYEKPFTEVTQGIWGWGLGATLWAEGAGQELWGELNWRRRLNDQWRFKTWLSGYYAIGGSGAGAGDILSSRKAIDYDKLTLGARFSRKLTRNSSLGLALEQALWGRNTSQDTTLKLEFFKSWE
jgi:hypothetical protein